MYSKQLKIGVLGSGDVGRVLASAFLKEGHQVMLGTRDPSKDQVVKWKKENSSGSTGDFADTAAFGDILVLATAGSVSLSVIEMAGKDNFEEKLVIDTTNPIATDAPVKGVLKFFTSLDHSLMEMIQEKIPAARVVKAFNSVGNTLMYKPAFKGVKPTMFICGNDAGAKKDTTAILEAFGWEVEDMGPAEAARAIEPLCILWCIPGFIRNEWTHAFKLLKQQ
jgi:8-hydroxy-5-deazaflavin:NADPH oxidoreductase